VLADRQVERRVGRVQVGMPLAPVGQPFDLDLPEHGAKCPPVAGLHPTARHLADIEHLLEAWFVTGSQLEMVLQQPTQQLTPAQVELLLQLAVGEPTRRVAVEPAHQHLEAFP
jgi:hypothetical protein